MKKLKIFVPEKACHHVLEPLPDEVEIVAEPEPDVELAVLGMQHAPPLPVFIAGLPQLRAVQPLSSEWTFSEKFDLGSDASIPVLAVDVDGSGIQFAIADLRGTGRLDIIAPGKDGLCLFFNEGI